MEEKSTKFTDRLIYSSIGLRAGNTNMNKLGSYPQEAHWLVRDSSKQIISHTAQELIYQHHEQSNMGLQRLSLRRLLLGRKVMTNLDSTFKSRDITLPTKVRLVKAMVFPVLVYGCESWTVKKAEH